MNAISFKTRVKNISINEAKNYKNTYVDYEYLIYASDFQKKFYIITGTNKNYLHLVGVHTILNQETFYNKCINGELNEDDFDFIDKNGQDIKGTVRRKIKVLNNMAMLMEHEKLYVQESFRKNNVFCTIGATDSACTVGFIKSSNSKTGKTFPRTLMKGNELKSAKEVELLLRKKAGKEKFDEIIIGSREMVKKFYSDIKEVIAIDLFGVLNSVGSKRYFGEIGILKKTKTPKCFQPNTYPEKLKRVKLKNKMRI